MMERKKSKGFTLVELLLVMTIMIILAILAVGAINPIAQINKGSDAKRKKDIGRIKISMEDYYNDKGCYPGQVKINELMDSANCGKGVFAPWLPAWPCDSRNEPYKLVIGPGSCPKWFKVFTKLENKADVNIPEYWNIGDKYVGSAAKVYSNSEVNYGMSSTNVKWNERAVPDSCLLPPLCMVPDQGTCDGVDCEGPNCYVGDCTNPACRVDRCVDNVYTNY